METCKYNSFVGCNVKNADCNNCEVYRVYLQGRIDERKKIMEIADSADDTAQVVYLLGQYIILEEIKEQKDDTF